MHHPKAPSLFAIAVSLALFASAVLTVPALADDGNPPAPPTDSTPAVDESAPAAGSSPSADPAADAPAPAGVLAALPDDTGVLALDQNGDALPLASQEAADVIATGDPIWCPTGKAPKAGIGGCSVSFGSLSELVAAFVPAHSGTIWIENGTDSGSEVVIDGLSSWSTAVNYNLTLQGGWIGGTTGSKAIIGASLFHTAINIVNWNGAVTINDIAIDSASNTFDSASGALHVTTRKNIVLSNVVVLQPSGVTLSGAYLDNTASTTQAVIIIKNSTFNYGSAGSSGAKIYSNGAVTLANVTAEWHGGYGLWIDNHSDLIPSSVTVTQGNFEGNGPAGLNIASNGAIKLSQVSSNGNVGTGIYLKNTYATTAQPVTVTGYVTASNNNDNGLSIFSNGAVALANIHADNNYQGAYIDNSTAASAKAVTIGGTNVFNNNQSTGLTILTKGAITTYNITSNSSVTGYGAQLFNNYSLFQSSIRIVGFNSFASNGLDGLNVNSNGAITAYNLTATDNNGYGVVLNTIGLTKPQPVSLKGNNQFQFNGDANFESGLVVTSDGNITVSNLFAGDNFFDGAALNNYSNWSLGTFATFGSVIQTGFANVANNGHQGIVVTTHGKVILSHVTATQNDNDGIGIYADGSVSLSCLMSTGNGWGIYMYWTSPVLTIKGLISYGNTHQNEQLDYGALIRTRCP